MADHDSGAVRAIDWYGLCPWLRILRTFRLATSLRILVLGAAGLLLTMVGWWGLAQVLLPDPPQAEDGTSAATPSEVRLQDARRTWKQEVVSSPWKRIDQAVKDSPELPGVPLTLTGEVTVPAPTVWRPADPFFQSWTQITQPLWAIFTNDRVDLGLWACLVLSALWALAVWAYFGGAITRIAAVQFATDERLGWAPALRYARAKWPSYFAAPLFPLLGIAVAAAPIVVAGLLMRWADWTVLPVAIFWPLSLLGGFIMALLLLGLVFGWPLMWTTISAEGTDSFDALSRSYDYVFHRPLRYLFYAFVAAVFGWLGWLLVSNFAAAIAWLTYWAASWGAGGERMRLIVAGEVAPTGSAVLHFWVGCVKLLALGFFYGYFWTAATAIYFFLRRDVDATEMDEVFQEADESEPGYSLPHPEEVSTNSAKPTAPESRSDGEPQAVPQQPSQA